MKKSGITYLLLVVIAFAYTGCREDTLTQNEVNNPVASNSPVLSSPANQSTVNSYFVNFDWEDYASSNFYRIVLATDANFALGILKDTIVSASAFNLAQQILTTNINYYWRVKSYGSDTSSWSQTWRFSVILSPPGPPDLSSPANNSNNVSFLPLFVWNSSATATAYRLQVSENVNFIPVLFDTNRIPSLYVQTPLFIINTNTHYYWRVLASNSNGVSSGPWSDVWNFTTVPGPQPNSISGRITFVNNDFITGRYLVSAYTDWPHISGIEGNGIELNIYKIGGQSVADFRFERQTNGNYYVASLFESPNGKFYFLGLYSCDTNRVQYSSCPLNPNYITINNNNGEDGKDFLSWADTNHVIIY